MTHFVDFKLAASFSYFCLSRRLFLLITFCSPFTLFTCFLSFIGNLLLICYIFVSVALFTTQELKFIGIFSGCFISVAHFTLLLWVLVQILDSCSLFRLVFNDIVFKVKSFIFVSFIVIFLIEDFIGSMQIFNYFSRDLVGILSQQLIFQTVK